jgi:hypothetical protein
MIALIAAAVLVVGGSVLIGGAIARLCGSASWGLLAPASGLAALLIACSIAVRLPGDATASSITVAVLIFGSAGLVLRPARAARPKSWEIIAAMLAGAAAILPFLASGRVGLLGMGTNDDMAEHLLAAWTLQGHAPVAASKLAESGYPVGPHALAATVAQATGVSLEQAFMAVMLAIPVLLALAAAALTPAEGGSLRGAVGAAVGVCYLQAAFLAQASFKEPMQALILVGLVAALEAQVPQRPQIGRAHFIPLAVLAAASVYVYSYPGLAWLVGTVVVWLAGRSLYQRRHGVRLPGRAPARTGSVLSACAVFVVLVALEFPRVLQFLGSGYNHEDSQTLGNLLRPLSPLEATGIWPSVDFRFDVPLRSISGILALAAVIAVAIALGRCVRRADLALPAAMVVALAAWGLSSARSPYTAAKSLAILAPLVTLLIGREMLLMLRKPANRRTPRALGAGFALVMIVAVYSDLKVLRDAPVGSVDHGSELASLRPDIRHSPTLFLGADDYVHWELRGADVATPPAPLYTTAVVPLRRTKARQDDRRLYRGRDRLLTFNRFSGLGLAFDFDSVPTSWLDRFTFVIVPRSAYASAPAPNWRLVRTTRSYALWRRYGPTLPHETLTEVDNPGAILDCTTLQGQQIARQQGIAMVKTPPVIGDRWWWRAPVGYAGTSTELSLRLGRGTWAISLQYASVVPVAVKALALNALLPANLEPLGPYWFVGVVRVPRAQRVKFVLSYARLTALGRSLGSTGRTRAPVPTGLLPRGRLTASRAPFHDDAIPLRRACGRYVDWYRLTSRARGWLR